MQPVEYRDVRAFSQSSLKLLDFNVNKFYKEEYLWVIGQIDTRKDEATPAMGLGSMVDVLCTGKEGDYEKEYEAIECGLSPQLKEFTEVLADLWLANSSADPDELGLSAYNIVGIKQSKYETIKAKFQAEALGYYSKLRYAKQTGKTVVTRETDDHAKLLYKGLLEDEFTGLIVGLKEGKVLEDGVAIWEVHNQLAIYWEKDGLRYKALLDKILISHRYKTIQPVDIKTTSKSDFREAFGVYRYDIQGAFYTDALIYWMKEQGIGDYEILPFKFIVAFTNEKGIGPQLWQMSDNDYAIGRLGTGGPNLRKVKGYQCLIDDLEWHIKEGKWKYSKDVYENNGIRMLNHYADASYNH